jgi:hypothetical protein
MGLGPALCTHQLHVLGYAHSLTTCLAFGAYLFGRGRHFALGACLNDLHIRSAVDAKAIRVVESLIAD